ncbi:MAG: hypothetical protein LBO04_01215 [Spirochaetaceae bacterium]|jgi:hypothetical protein|nr:hypothetical protein [Spirochaetaceae bacterium]
MGIENVTYDSEHVLVNVQGLNAVPYAAGTYKKGQLLGRVDSTGVFGAYTAGVATGLEVIRAVCPDDFTVPSGGGKHHVLYGEFSRAGVAAVMASLDTPVTLTDALVGMCFDAGIILN